MSWPMSSSSSTGGGMADTLLTDTSGTLFMARDNGTTIAYVTVPNASGVPSAYTPVSTPQPVAASISSGTGGTGIAIPSGGTGLAGWLSGIYSRLSGALAVTGTFWQATQPVSVAALPALTAGAATIGSVNVLGGNATAVKTDSSATTQPVSGTFFQATQPVSAAALPLPAGAATQATLVSLDGKSPALVNGRVPVDHTGVIQMGGGAMTASTQRVTLATDGPEVTNSTAIAANTAKIPSKGTAAMAGATPVTLATDDAMVGVKAAAAVIGTGGSGIIGWLSDVATSLKGILSITGTRSNAGTDTAAGTTHISVGGSDGINLRPLMTDTAGRVVIAGTAPVGSAPTANPVSVSGIDGSGNKQHFLTDTAGRLVVNVNTSALPTLAATSVNQPTLNSGAATVSGFQGLPSDGFMRPADTVVYAVGDLIANSTTAGSVTVATHGILTLTAARVAAGSFILRRLRLRKTSISLTSASFRVHLFSTIPVPAIGDNGVLTGNVSGFAGHIGYVDILMDTAWSDGANGASMMPTDFNIALTSGQNIYALLEARAAYTPGSGETFTLTAEVLQN